MQCKIFILTGLLVLGVFACQKVTHQDSFDTISQILEKQSQAWNRGDIQDFMAYYWRSDSLRFVGANGITYGWQNLLDRYQRVYPDDKAMGKLTFTLIHFDDLGESAVQVTGKWQLKREEDEPGGYFTLVFKKIDDQWLIISDHTS